MVKSKRLSLKNFIEKFNIQKKYKIFFIIVKI